MDKSKEYKYMCSQATEIQKQWYPRVGDWISTKSSYCDEDDDNCTDTSPCEDCFDHSNIYVVSGKFDFHSSVGGTKWYFGGHSSVRGMGNRMNSTSCYVMTKEDQPYGESDFNSRSYKSYVWLPRVDQYIRLLSTNMGFQYDLQSFTNALDIRCDEYSIEESWLEYFMSLNYGKSWVDGEWKST